MDELSIQPTRELPEAALELLIEESIASGFGMLMRLRANWQSGVNRFDRPGEALFLAKDSEHVVGVCGLNIDPYGIDSRIGRVRHLYVEGAYRRLGIGKALVGQIIREARRSFTLLTLRTDSPSAAAFYEQLRFRRTSVVRNATHCFDLTALPQSEADRSGNL